MDDQTDHHAPQPAPARTVRLPSRTGTLALAAVMLGIGLGAGAAIGPSPDTSLAGSASDLARRLPVLLATLSAQHRAAAKTSATPVAEPPPVTPRTTPATAPPPAESSGSAPKASSEAPAASSAPARSAPKKKTLPAITNVWLVELSGGTFEAALARPAATPYTNGQLLPASTLLKNWSALEGSAFATDTALAEPPSGGSAPPLLHSIVQPPCPEAATAACGPETPGQLTVADEFLKATLTTITGTSTYKEHGLIVVTFATVGIASQSELPAGASTATLTYQPPAGVALLSPFVKAGQRSTVAFDTASPRQSLEKLLH